MAKEKEKELRTTMARLQAEIERERAKVKSIQEKVTFLSNLSTYISVLDAAY